jgi:hypothetical protein
MKTEQAASAEQEYEALISTFKELVRKVVSVQYPKHIDRVPRNEHIHETFEEILNVFGKVHGKEIIKDLFAQLTAGGITSEQTALELACCKQDIVYFYLLSSELRTNKEFIKKLLELAKNYYPMLNREMKNDPEIVLCALRSPDHFNLSSDAFSIDLKSVNQAYFSQISSIILQKYPELASLLPTERLSNEQLFQSLPISMLRGSHAQVIEISQEIIKRGLDEQLTTHIDFSFSLATLRTKRLLSDILVLPPSIQRSVIRTNIADIATSIIYLSSNLESIISTNAGINLTILEDELNTYIKSAADLDTVTEWRRKFYPLTPQLLKLSKTLEKLSKSLKKIEAVSKPESFGIMAQALKGLLSNPEE